ncbi:MAG: response regulator [Blastocatellia bacterium]
MSSTVRVLGGWFRVFKETEDDSSLILGGVKTIGADSDLVGVDTRSEPSRLSLIFDGRGEERVSRTAAEGSIRGVAHRACKNDPSSESAEDQEDKASPRRCRAIAYGYETILLVEDDAGVRAYADHVLRSQGHRVLKAASGDEALRLSQTFRDRIDLLLTDAVMPEMGGLELAERIGLERPEMKILVMSGYCERLVELGALKFPLLQKPFSPQDLVAKVSQLLDS